MGVVTSNVCDFCKTEKDNIKHLFWNCTCVRRFWQALESLMKEKCVTAAMIKLSESIVLFGTDNNVKTDNVFDLIVLLAKLFIYKCKLEKTVPTIFSFKRQLSQKYRVEEYNAKINFELFKFNIDWLPYKSMFLEDN